MTTTTVSPEEPEEGTEESTAETRQAAGLLSPEAYEQAVVELVMATAPKLFAVIEEDVEAPDARVVSWGLAFEDAGTQVMSPSGNYHAVLQSPDSALRPFTGSGGTKGRLVWVTPDLVLQQQLTR